MGQKVSERSTTTTTTGAYFHIIIPDGLGGYLSRKIAYSVLEAAITGTGTTDNIRAKGSIAATAGEQTITFEVGGEASPLASADYSLLVWSDVEGMVTPTAQDENGFTVDLIDACNLSYQAILNT